MEVGAPVLKKASAVTKAQARNKNECTVPRGTIAERFLFSRETIMHYSYSARAAVILPPFHAVLASFTLLMNLHDTAHELVFTNPDAVKICCSAEFKHTA